MTIVLAHPVAMDATMWPHVVTEQLAAEHAVALYEMPGHGDRRLEPAATSITSLADDLIGFCRSVAGTPGSAVHVVGLSIGGALALNAAIMAPELITSIVVACSAAAFDPDTMLARAEETLRFGVAETVPRHVERWLGAGCHDEQPELADRVARQALQMDVHALANTWRALATHDVRAAAPALRLPVTVLYGDADTAAGIDGAKSLAALIAGSRLAGLPGAHFAPIQSPDAFVDAIRAHIVSVAAICG